MSEEAEHITKTKFYFEIHSMAWMNKLIFFLVYFGHDLILPILGKELQVPPHYQVVNVSSLIPKSYCEKSTSAIGSQKLEIVSRHGPCFPNAKTPTSDSEQLMNWDQVRVRSINKKLKKPLEGKYDNGDYTVKIGLGTPRQDFYLMFDTGSTKTWVRCKSCTKGCKSVAPLYDPSKSSTYINNTDGCNGPFNVNYIDNSSIKGIWGCDTFTGDNKGLATIMKFQFGCSQEINGDFDDISGILGLGKGEFSVTSQIASTMEMFSYYIPSRSSLTGNLYFGNEAKEISNACSSNKFTPLVEGKYPENYYVDLVGISVAGKKLNVSSTTFTSLGTIIDSGTVITRLPQVVYSALRDAFRQYMLSYTLLDEVDELMDTCYSLEGIELIALPEIKFHFGKESIIDVTLTKEGTLWTPHDSNGSIMCLAFASTKDFTIIGSVQQRGLNVIYDLKGERIGFGTNCPTK
ncbi:aspartyl protease AED1-like [Solanum dulcamara]|uniref:aspartyl protease AED1-like n=1 Tax=Solanum dulcamara TaxID=45834 RepID=UPI002484F2BB|nr:aspartyl protease AED1-like [Solanum dulcamara]